MNRSGLNFLSAALVLGLPFPLADIVTQAPDADPGDADAVADATVTIIHWWQSWPAVALLVIALLGFWLARRKPYKAGTEAALFAPTLLAGCALPFVLLALGMVPDVGVWVFLVGIVALIWHELALLSTVPGWVRRLLVPGIFGLSILYGWEVIVDGFQVPFVLLPPPSAVAVTLVDQAATLWGDFGQTVLKSVVRGYLMGCGAGFVVAILADRIPFLARGLLPFGNLVAALPVVGVAPIMVMWFGFEWQSKAAVVVVMTFFPMLVNTLAGLATAERLQLDLMRSYAAGYWRTLFMLRLPNALPFIFNALKINSTLALIGAIVAEFFGTPVLGMGFRISTAVARMDLGVVWATIVVAALTGSLVYGGLALTERFVTAWHPSYRKR